MNMTGKELPIYDIDSTPTPFEQVVAIGSVNDIPCTLSVVREGGDHLLVATVNGRRVAISGSALLGVAANLEVSHV